MFYIWQLPENKKEAILMFGFALIGGILFYLALDKGYLTMSQGYQIYRIWWWGWCLFWIYAGLAFCGWILLGTWQLVRKLLTKKSQYL